MTGMPSLATGGTNFTAISISLGIIFILAAAIALRSGGQLDARNDRVTTDLRLFRNPLRQAISASTWSATWFLLANLVVGWLLFSAVLGAGLAAITLAITLAGLPFLVAAAAVIRGCANAER